MRRGTKKELADAIIRAFPLPAGYVTEIRGMTLAQLQTVAQLLLMANDTVAKNHAKRVERLTK